MANAAPLKTAAPRGAPHLPAGEPPAHGSTGFVYAMLTHAGRVRHANQDACAAAPEHSAFVVCDGVGGAAGGEVASQLAAETFLGALLSSSVDQEDASANKEEVPYSSAVPRAGTRTGGVEHSSSSTPARLRQAVLAANHAVFARAQKNRNLRGMATTLVAALLEHASTTNNEQRTTDNPSLCPTLWLAHAGDSRAYRLRASGNGEPHQFTQLTCDHSLVEEQVAAGILSRHDALRSPVRNVITRAIGAAPSVEPEIASHAIDPGDLYLLASDGLTRELSDPAIARILTATLNFDSTELRAPHSSHDGGHAMGGIASAPLEAAAHALIDAANEHGGRDNITVMLIACR